MSKLEKILFIVILVVITVTAVWVGRQMWQTALGAQTSAGGPTSVSSDRYRAAKSAEDPNNPCTPPAGYTEESWREHMGHHPDQYKQCLGR